MKFTSTYNFDQDVDSIYASYVKKKFVKTKMEALGARNIDLDISKEKKSAAVEIIREMPAEVPSALKKFVKPWNKLTQKEEWSGKKGGPYSSEINVEFDGVPVSIHSFIELEATEDGSSITIETEVKCSILFVGKILAKFVADASSIAIDKELEYISEHA